MFLKLVATRCLHNAWGRKKARGSGRVIKSQLLSCEYATKYTRPAFMDSM